MDDTIRTILKDKLAQHGHELIGEAERCENMFEVLPATAKLEKTALIVTLKEGVPQRLINMPAANLTASAVRNYAVEISQKTGLREDVARWAVETWAFGLGLQIAGTSGEPPPPGPAPKPKSIPEPFPKPSPDPVPKAGQEQRERTARAITISGSVALLILVVASLIVFYTSGPSTGRLTVSAPPELAFTGEQGGPFSPSGIALQLKAVGAGLRWSTANAPAWLSVVPNQGELATEGSMRVTLVLTPAAQSLTPGRYESQVLLKNDTAGVVVVSNVGIVVSAESPPAVVTPPVVNRAAPLSSEREWALNPKDTFQECPNCPQMIVLPAGSFIMGSPASEPGSFRDERPQHRVAIAQKFAVGQYEVTFDEWDACVAAGGCNGFSPQDFGWGRGRRPVVAVSWPDAKAYVAWLSNWTGKIYRLLSEAEYEYAARAGTTTAYPWGSAVGINNANCLGCGSQWDNRQTAPVGSFAANDFGLFDMVGNVWEWTEDCYHDNYKGAPADGSAWTTGACINDYHVVRGGSWNGTPDCVRSANRYRCTVVYVGPTLGFRVARALVAP